MLSISSLSALSTGGAAPITAPAPQRQLVRAPAPRVDVPSPASPPPPGGSDGGKATPPRPLPRGSLLDMAV